jgi:hypothetical protein
MKFIAKYLRVFQLVLWAFKKKKGKKQSYPHNRPWRSIGLWDVKDPTLSRQSAQMSALRTSRDLLPRSINFMLLEVISVTGSVQPRALYRMKDYVNWKCIHYKGPWTRDLPDGIIERFPFYTTERLILCVC